MYQISIVNVLWELKINENKSYYNEFLEKNCFNLKKLPVNVLTISSKEIRYFTRIGKLEWIGLGYSMLQIDKST